MKKIRAVAAIAALAAFGACSDLVVPDYNNPSLEDLTGNPTPTKIAQAAQ